MNVINESLSFNEPYSKLKDTENELKILINHLIQDFYNIKNKENDINDKIDQLINADTSDMSNMENQNFILKKQKLLKEYRGLLQQYRSKQSMLLRNLTEISKSVVDQPQKMQSIIEQKQKSENSISELSESNLSKLTFQTVITIAENLMTKDLKENKDGK